MWRNALSAVISRLSAFAGRAGTAACARKTEASTSGTAPSTSLTPKPDATAQWERLLRRGLTFHNRNRRAAERYARMHLILSRGACSDAPRCEG